MGKRLRVLVLITVFSSVVLVLVRTSLYKESVEPLSVGIQLPAEVPLDDWEFRSSDTLKEQKTENSGYLAGQKYLYERGFYQLNIQVRYITPTNGDVRGFVTEYLHNSSKYSPNAWEMHSINGMGPALLKDDTTMLQLSSCLNPYGGSTVSIEDYKRNRNFQDIRFRLVPWLLGEPLKDERCLWIHMAMTSSQETSLEVQQSLLERAWIDWLQWWSVRFLNM